MKKNKQKNVKEKIFNPPTYFKYIPWILLFIFFSLSLYIRAVLPFDTVFKDGIIRFAADDAVFHMRLVENTLHNFPHRLNYDAFTYYPTGNNLHWGPLFTLIIATTSMIIGFGNPSMQLVNTVGAFMPAIMGALVVFPIYYIANKLFNNKLAGLIAALMIAVLPGQFLGRTVLGFTDHHAAEVLFSTLTIALYLATLEHSKSNIKPIHYSILTGLMLGAYLLTWIGAVFFIMIIMIYVVVQSVIDTLQNKDIKYLSVSTIPMLIVTLILLIPFSSTEFVVFHYSLFHIALILISIVSTIILIKLNTYARGTKNPIFQYLISIVIISMLSLITIRIVSINVYNTLFGTLIGMFTHTVGGAQTIAESNSIFARPGMIHDSFPIMFIPNDNLTLIFIIIALIIISVRIIKQKHFELMFITWSVIMLLAVCSQNRWTYYFAVNFAIICGFVGSSIIHSWTNKHKSDMFNPNTKNIPITICIISIITFILAYPGFNYSINNSKYVNNGEPSGGGFNEWFETLNWVKNNTPDTGVDYYGIYNKPYTYPDTAYGILSWWDYGHIITYYAHRIPTANPFQAGIGGGHEHNAGASTFLTAKTEEEATKELNKIDNVKYIISNAYMAYEIMQVFGIWNEDEPYFAYIQTNKGNQLVPNEVYFKNMESRLHILDGNGLKQYRLIYESNINPNTHGGHREQQFKHIYNLLYGGNIPIVNSGLVKVFEHVNGAHISGLTDPNTKVNITHKVKTNIGREFEYSQEIISSSNIGSYIFVVPYTGEYNLLGKNISINESNVINGDIVYV